MEALLCAKVNAPMVFTLYRSQTFLINIFTADVAMPLDQYSNSKTVEEALADYEETLLPNATSFGQTVYVDGKYVGDVWCYCIDMDDEPNCMLSFCIFELE